MMSMILIVNSTFSKNDVKYRNVGCLSVVIMTSHDRGKARLTDDIKSALEPLVSILLVVYHSLLQTCQIIFLSIL